MRHFCLMYNVTWKAKGNATPWKMRHGYDFQADLHPFGCKVHYTPGTTKANAGEDKFSPSSVPGILVGYHLNPGGIWSKDFLVINLEAAQSNGSARNTPVIRVGKVIRERGEPLFPMRTSEIEHTDSRPTDVAVAPPSHDQEESVSRSNAEREHRPDRDDLPKGII